jgi:hypothetical protein
MSDLGRKDFGDSMFSPLSVWTCPDANTLSTEAKESMQPDSTKSTTEKLKEGITGTTDKISRYVFYFVPPTPLTMLLTNLPVVSFPTPRNPLASPLLTSLAAPRMNTSMEALASLSWTRPSTLSEWISTKSAFQTEGVMTEY